MEIYIKAVSVSIYVHGWVVFITQRVGVKNDADEYILLLGHSIVKSLKQHKVCHLH